ncbi:MAG: Fic family protein [Flavobacteriales bacterium]|jgi:Fic family protein|nr:Fic family protein [Flavobacteriales bacterium]MBK6891591.1 Fic family protein [Flavobacteriales bacterium]MBK7247517.1 Fic family protein [Flavobacteriales bacterium]QQS72806.1 MAG: Fic family protein [Flavobacteriales bacterium]HQV37523.1 Fic family protein [Flavobacteriales bacterium]
MLTEALDRIDSLKSELDALRPLAPEDEQRLWQKLRLEWNYNSNHIEGNTLTYGETFLLLIHGQTNGGHSMREFEEMKAHDVAVSMVRSWADDPERPLLEINLRELNKILLKDPFWKEAITPDGQPTRVQILPGEYKRQPNNVRLANGEIFRFASVEETPAKVHELMDWFAQTEDLHPVEKAAIFHHSFVAIHPFGDGNGRTARLITNYILMRAGYMPVVIKSADKSNYLRALQQADAGDLQPFTEYLAEQEEWALELGIKAGKGERIEESNDLHKRLNVLSKQFANMDPDLTVQWTFSREHLLWMLDAWISPMFEELIQTTQQFHQFFIKPAHHLYLREEVGEIPHVTTNMVASMQFADESPTAVSASLRQQIIDSDASLNSGGRFVFNAFLGDFKFLGKNGFGCVYHAEVVISYHHYEVHIDQFNEGSSKRKSIKVAEGLLHKALPPSIIEDINRQFGNAVASHVEHWVNRGGMEPPLSGATSDDQP